MSITGCNFAYQCVTGTSDGVLVDTSPPIPGKVIDGIGDKDIRYQSSRYNSSCFIKFLNGYIFVCFIEVMIVPACIHNVLSNF